MAKRTGTTTTTPTPTELIIYELNMTKKNKTIHRNIILLWQNLFVCCSFFILCALLLCVSAVYVYPFLSVWLCPVVLWPYTKLIQPQNCLSINYIVAILILCSVLLIFVFFIFIYFIYSPFVRVILPSRISFSVVVALAVRFECTFLFGFTPKL